MFLFLLLILFLVYNYMVAKLYFWVTEGASELPLDGLVSFIGGTSILILLSLVFVMVVVWLLLIVHKFCGFVVFMLSNINFSKVRLLCSCIYKRVVVCYSSVSNFFGYFYNGLKFFYKNERPLLSIIAMLKLLAKGVIDYPGWALGHIVSGVVVVKDFIMLHKIFFSLLAVAIVAGTSVFFIMDWHHQAALARYDLFMETFLAKQDAFNASQKADWAAFMKSTRSTQYWGDVVGTGFEMAQDMASARPVAAFGKAAQFMVKHPPGAGAV